MTVTGDRGARASPTFSLEAVRREGLIAAGGRRAGRPRRHRPGRAGVHRRGQGGAADRSAQVRVPPGVTVFDSASWNGIAIDSTCGGHGTCHKCKVRVTPGDPGHPARRPDVQPRRSSTTGWRLACLVRATRDHEVVVPPLTTRPKAATVGVGRQVILRPAVQKRYVELTEPTLEDQRTDLDRLLDAIDDLEPRADLHVLRRLPEGAARGGLQGDRGRRRRGPDRRRARRHHAGARYAIAFDLGTTTVVATLLDLVTGTPGRGGLDAQQAAALRRRRDQPDQRHDARPDGARRGCSVAACETLATLADQVCREGGVDPPTSTRPRSPATPR